MTRLSASIAACVALLCSAVGRAGADDDSRQTELLRARYAEMQEQLTRSPFPRPIQVSSTEASTGATADVYALVDFPFSTVSDSLSRPDDWCDILSLHLNIKYCRASTAADENRIDVVIGRKHDQPLADAYRLDFGYLIAARSSSYLRVALDADEGPFATRDYRIVVEGVEVAPAQTLIHLSYSHGYGSLGGIAMKVYLETVARKKVGFTVVGTGSDGLPRYVGGMRGVVERNTMRYYLAIESFFGALSTPLSKRFEKRLHDWFAAVERYPRQLHEMEKSAYLDMKRKQRSRQSEASSSAAYSRGFDHHLAQDVSGDGFGPLAIARDAPRHGIDPREAAVEDPIELRTVVPARGLDQLIE